MKLPKSMVMLYLIFTSIAYAQDWRQLGNSHGVEITIDTDSIKKVEDSFETYTRLNYSAPQVTEFTEKKNYRSKREVNSFNCNDRTFKNLEETFYPEPMWEGTAVAYSDAGRHPMMSYHPVKPGTIQGKQLDFVCRWVKEIGVRAPIPDSMPEWLSEKITKDVTVYVRTKSIDSYSGNLTLALVTTKFNLPKKTKTDKIIFYQSTVEKLLFKCDQNTFSAYETQYFATHTTDGSEPEATVTMTENDMVYRRADSPERAWPLKVVCDLAGRRIKE